ncbi:MAG: hypothetical protein ABW174_12685 [Flavitalea sp.]
MNEFDILQSSVDKYYGQLPGSHQSDPIAMIVGEKINALISDRKTSWSKFVSSLADRFHDIKDHDSAYIQFPSYQLNFPLSSKGFDAGTKRSRFVVTLSLLCPFYTSFIHDEFLFDTYDVESPPTFSIIRPAPSDSAFLQTLQPAIYSGLESEFSSYRYLDHTLLMMRMVPGLFPYPEYKSDDQKNFTSSYYRLLFDGSFIESNYSVLTGNMIAPDLKPGPLKTR